MRVLLATPPENRYFNRIDSWIKEIFICRQKILKKLEDRKAKGMVLTENKTREKEIQPKPGAGVKYRFREVLLLRVGPRGVLKVHQRTVVGRTKASRCPFSPCLYRAAGRSCF